MAPNAMTPVIVTAVKDFNVLIGTTKVLPKAPVVLIKLRVVKQLSGRIKLIMLFVLDYMEIPAPVIQSVTTSWD